MALENLYQCSKAEVSSLYIDLAKAFYTDDLYHVAFPNEDTRKQCMEYFFKHYLKAIAPECYFLADSKERNAVMVIYDSRRYNRRSYWFRLLKMNVKFLKFIKLIGIKNSIKLLREWDMFSSRWVKSFVTKEHFHLDLIYTNEEYRKQGVALKMIKELLDEAIIMEMDVSVETHHEDNANWYKKMGFVLMNTVVDAASDLHQYCLLIRNLKE